MHIANPDNKLLTISSRYMGSVIFVIQNFWGNYGVFKRKIRLLSLYCLMTSFYFIKLHFIYEIFPYIKVYSPYSNDHENTLYVHKSISLWNSSQQRGNTRT